MARKLLTDYKITKSELQSALNVSQQILNDIKNYVKLSEKVKSEIVSGVVEKELAKSLTKAHGFAVNSPNSDNDPDLLFTGFPRKSNSVEIKVALMESGTGQWRSGAKSQRNAPTLFIARNKEMTKVFASLVHMGKAHWTPANNQSYYAVTYSKRELLTRTSRLDLMGSIQKKKLKSGKEHPTQISMMFEKLP